MFLMLSQNPEVPVDPSALKSSRPPSRKTSVDLSQSGQQEPQRKKLQLLPQSKPTVEEEARPVASSEVSEDDVPTESPFDAEAQKRMEEDSKEFLDEAEVYFTNLPNDMSALLKGAGIDKDEE
jgi:translation initiation factor 4G